MTTDVFSNKTHSVLYLKSETHTLERHPSFSHVPLPESGDDRDAEGTAIRRGLRVATRESASSQQHFAVYNPPRPPRSKREALPALQHATERDSIRVKALGASRVASGCVP